jgi:hypothetical protein
VLAEGFFAHFALLNEAYYFALGKRMFFTANLNVADIARDAERYEHHQLIPVEQAFAFSCNSLDGNVLKEGKWLFISWHNTI